MTRFLNDQAKLVFLWESGTYAVTSGNGVWIGLVQEHEITENQNVIQTRFLGQGNRNLGRFDNGPLDIEGTFTYYPQDWKLFGLAVGSIWNSGLEAGNSAQFISQVHGGQRFSAFTSGYFNPWPSFTLEESRTGAISNQNSVRTIKGVNINSYTININQGEPVSCEVGFVAQTGSWFSGATTSVTAGSFRPYLWSDVTFQLPGATTQESVKSVTLSYNNNMEAPHYVNGSRVIQVPYPLNAECTVEITQDLDSVMVGSLYNVYFQGGSLFNAVLDIEASSANAGSHRLITTMSGCRIIEMTTPVSVGEISEVTYTLVPGSISAIAYDRYSYTPF